MKKIADIVEGIAQTASTAVVDGFDKVASPASRAGSTLERIGKLIKADIPAESIVPILNARSANGHVYTLAGVTEMANLFNDCETRVGITKQQSNALAEDQETYGGDLLPN